MSIKKRLLIFICVVIVPLLLVWTFQKKYMVINGETMGTSYTIKCYSPKWITKNNIKSKIEKELNRINAIFSTWDTQSEISTFNQLKSLENVEISDDFKKLVELSYKLHRDTTGYFDPTIKTLSDIWGFGSDKSFFSIPSRIELDLVAKNIGLDKLVLADNKLRKLNPDVELDLSAIVKGYAVDQIALLLESVGSKKYMVEIGGEVRVLTKKDKPWKIGINKPKYHDIEQSLLGSVDLTNSSLATSGDYQNFFEKNGVIYSHIINSKKGSPSQSKITSVSIIAPNCILADGLATSIMAMGVNRGLSLIESYYNVEGLIIVRNNDNSLEMYQSSGLKKVNYQSYTSL